MNTDTDRKMLPSTTRYLWVALLFLFATNALADSQAVQETNYQFGLASGDRNTYGGGYSNTYGVNGTATFPVLPYVGASLYGAFDRTNIHSDLGQTGTTTTTTPSSGCKLEDAGVDAALFVRDPTIGRIGVSYGADRVHSLCSATFVATRSSRLDTTSYGANAEYYFSRVTVAGSRTWAHVQSSGTLNSDELSASWYPVDNLRLSVSAQGLDLKDTYGFNLEYQPDLLDNSTSLLLGYSEQHQNTTNNFIMVGFIYYFDTRVDLLTRDRRYR